MTSDTRRIAGTGVEAGTESHLWGAAEVRARLKEAAAVLRALALGLRDRPAGLMAHWPDVVRQGFEAYGYDSVRLRPPTPSPAAVSRADAAVLWLLWLEDAPRRIAWARASGIPWRRLEDLDGRSHTTLRRVEGEALAAICRRLNASLAPEAAIAAAFAQGVQARRESPDRVTTKDRLTKFRK
ncbi:MAG: hypothetical protein GEU76_00170 [Alphaproteobacteria bacterium]|nr:hypothetical protein [Alphaproteobacteria bacterium]